MNTPPPHIFREYDIRGLVGAELSESVVEIIGRAFGSELGTRTENRTCAVGRDGRHSSPNFSQAMINGLRQTGIEVVDVGLVPTPLVYYGSHVLDTAGAVVITGSHNPPDFNGLKFAFNKLPFACENITGLYDRIERQDFNLQHGSVSTADLVDRYIREVLANFEHSIDLKVVLDCANGVTGVLARKLFEQLGCQVDVLFEEIDGSFPNHPPDPCIAENISQLRTQVVATGADVGIGFDGDGDRLAVVTETGDAIPTDRLMAIFAQEILQSEHGGTVVYDIKCGRCVPETIHLNGGKGILSPTGHTNIKTRVVENQALLGGELSGHVCFPDRWYPIDDALYAAVRVLELLANHDKKLSEYYAEFNSCVATEELFLTVDEQRKFDIVERLKFHESFSNTEKELIDGVRVEYKDGWGLVRASNTSPKLSMRFEGETAEALARIQGQVRQALNDVDPELANQSW